MGGKNIKETIQQRRYIQLDLWRWLSVVVTLLLGAFVSGTFTGLATANSDHFVLAHLVGRVDKIEATAVHKDVWVSESASTAKRLDRIESQLDRLNNTLDTWKVTQ